MKSHTWEDPDTHATLQIWADSPTNREMIRLAERVKELEGKIDDADSLPLPLEPTAEWLALTPEEQWLDYREAAGWMKVARGWEEQVYRLEGSNEALRRSRAAFDEAVVNPIADAMKRVAELEEAILSRIRRRLLSEILDDPAIRYENGEAIIREALLRRALDRIVPEKKDQAT